MLSDSKSPTPRALRCESLSRLFRRRTRKEGLRAAVKSFFKAQYVENHAVENVTFEINEGACVGLVGANGAGKTTLLKMCAGLLHPSHGEIEVLGFKPFERRTPFLKSIGMVMGQKSQLWMDIPASDTYALLRAIYRVPKVEFETRLHELSELFKVEKLLGVQIRRLSLGERMKLEVIAALLHRPRLLFLDEPTIGLDLLAKHTIREFIRAHNKKFNTTIFLSSHDMEDIVESCDRLLVMAKGQLRYDGTVTDFQSRPDSFTNEMRKLISE